MDAMEHINTRLIGSPRSCPTATSWGECLAISKWGHNGNHYHIATIYWWRQPPEPSVVKQWIEEAGYICYSIDHVLWCNDGTYDETKDMGIVQWNVSFGPREDEPTQPRCHLCGKQATEDNWLSSWAGGNLWTCEQCHHKRKVERREPT